MRFVTVLLPALLGASLLAADPDPQDIIRRAFQADLENEKLAQQYTFREREETRKLDKSGAVNETESETFDVLFFHEEAYERLIERNDQPLSAKDEAKQKKKLDDWLSEREDESEKKREKRLAKKAEEEEKRRKMAEEFTRSFDFTLEGSEVVAGADSWKIRGDPKPDYEPTLKEAKFFSKMRGMMWVSKADYGWTKIEAETIDNVSFGLFLLKLREGAKMRLNRVRVNDEVWLEDDFVVNFSAKIAALANLRREVAIDWSDFRKFSAESKLITAEAQ